MAIGGAAASSATEANVTLARLAAESRDLATKQANWAGQVIGLGLDGLQADPYNYTPGDAQAMMDKAGEMNSLAGLFRGTIAQADKYSYEDSFSRVWGFH